MRKYDKHTSSYETPVTGYVRRFRLAELYLNFAEAANEAYGPTQQVEGYSGQASMLGMNILRIEMCSGTGSGMNVG